VLGFGAGAALERVRERTELLRRRRAKQAVNGLAVRALVRAGKHLLGGGVEERDAQLPVRVVSHGVPAMAYSNGSMKRSPSQNASARRRFWRSSYSVSHAPYVSSAAARFRTSAR